MGFGPRLFGITRDGTEYRLSLVPLGGYVMPDITDENAFFDFPISHRIILTTGGPAASIVLPLFCFALPASSAPVSASTRSSSNLLHKRQLFSGRPLPSSPLLFSHHSELSGIAGIVSQGGRYIGSSVVNLLSFAGLMSINLAVLNLLPVPVLDGGKILMYSLEKFSRKFVKFHYPLAIAGWVLMLAIMAYATVLDVGRLV